jgi:hypothetical protein
MGLLSWLASRFFRKARSPLNTVSFDDQEIRLISGDKLVWTIRWDDLEAVYIDTTDTGPFVDDVFLVLSRANDAFVIPLGTGGDSDLLRRLGEFPGFNHDAASSAMCCTDNNRFICWRRDGSDRQDTSALAGSPE